MERLFARNPKAFAAAASAAAALLILMIAAIAEGDPTRAHTRALLKLRAGRRVTILITGGCVNPFVGPADEDNKAPYAWFVGYLQHAYAEANISTVRSLWADATAQELVSLVEPVLGTVKPDITILCVGASDYRVSTPADAYDAGCAALTKTVKRLGGFAVVAGAILPQVEAARPIHIHTRRSARDAGCVYVSLDAILRNSEIPIGALLRDERWLTAKGTLLLADGLIRAWCQPLVQTQNLLPAIGIKILEGESSLGGYIRGDTTLRPHGHDTFHGDVTIFFGETTESRPLAAVPGRALVTPWILRLPDSLPSGRSAVTPVTMQLKDPTGKTRCRMRYVVIAPGVFVDTRSPPPRPRGPERFRLGPANLVFGKYGGASDIDVEVEVKGDAAALYITAVIDDQVVVREPAGSEKPGDRVEILLDLRPNRQVDIAGVEKAPARPQTYGDWQGQPIAGPNVYRMILTPPTMDGSPAFRVESLQRPRRESLVPTTRHDHPAAPRNPRPETSNRKQDAAQQVAEQVQPPGNREGLAALQEAEASSAMKPTGYKTGVRVPWAPLHAAAGRAVQSFGFDVVVQDVDGPMLPRTRLVLFGADPPDPSLFGMITHNSRYRVGLVRVIAP